MKSLAMTIFGMVVLGVGLAGCDRVLGKETPEVVQPAKEYHSPYFLTGEGDLPFEKISFTDVGLNQPEPGPADAFLLETIAEALAYEIAAHDGIDFVSTVEYDDALKDPANHLYCDKAHLYVALWRGYDPERWGYSLWSGCHEAQEFAWKEVPDPYTEEVDVLTWVEPLVSDMTEAIHEAQSQECYTATC